VVSRRRQPKLGPEDTQLLTALEGLLKGILPDFVYEAEKLMGMFSE